MKAHTFGFLVVLVTQGGCSIDLTGPGAAGALSLDGAFSADIIGDPATARAGIFFEREASPDGEVTLDVRADEGGRVAVSRVGGATGAYALDPLLLRAGAGEHTFDIEMPQGDVDLVILAWVDANLDNRLDVADDGTAEAAFALHRVYEGDDYYLSIYGYSPVDETYNATAVSGDFGNLILNNDFLDGWDVDLEGR